MNRETGPHLQKETYRHGASLTGLFSIFTACLLGAMALAAYIKTEGIENVCLAYFGMDSPEYRGISHRPLTPADKLADLDCVAAVSVTYLEGLYLPSGDFT